MGRSIYLDIYRDLRKQIMQGEFAQSGYLPSETELMQHYGCSRMTVRKAISLLANEGKAQAIRGKGVRVLCDGPNATSAEKAFSVDGLRSFTESAREIGATPSSQLFMLEHVDCSAGISQQTGFPEGEDLTHVGLVRYLNGHVVALDRHYFLTSKVPGIDQKVATSSLFRYIEDDLGIKITVSNREVTVEEPTDEDRERMGITKPLYVAVVRSRTFDSTGTQFEHVESKYLPSVFHFFDSATRTPLP